MKKVCPILAIIVGVLLLFAPEASGCPKVVVKEGMDYQKVFAAKNTKYVIKEDIRLGGKTIIIGDGSILVFKKGSLVDGTLKGDFELKGVERNSLGVKWKIPSKVVPSFRT